MRVSDLSEILGHLPETTPAQRAEMKGKYVVSKKSVRGADLRGISRASVLAVVNPKVAGAARFRACNRIVLHATFKALLSRKLLTQRLFTGIIALRNLG